VTLDEVRQDLATELFEKKQELAINNYFARIEGDARVENFLTGTIKESTREITAAQPPATRTQ